MIGEQFGNYRAVSLLGEGGMGAVYLAEHPGIGRRVAVKVLHKNYIRDEGLLTRFLNEARAANAIRHPNIIEILDSGTIADGTPFLVMELLEGESLGTRLRRVGALAIPTAVEFAYQTASALGAAHKKGIVHRDLKPDNLFVIPDPHEPERERIKVLDFGIAKLQQGSTGDSVKTRTGTLMGTPIYMSPEQCRGTRAVDHRSDIYSLGIIFFEMLVGQPPFVSEGFGELVNMHLNVAAPAPSSQRADISPAIDAVVARMLAKNPDDRFPNMAQVQAALKASGGTQFVVRGAVPSSPELGGKTPAPTGPIAVTRPRGSAPPSPKVHDTTFTTGVGERVGPPAGAPRKGKGVLIVLGVAAAVAAAGVFIFRDGEKVGVRDEASKVAPPPVVAAKRVETPVVVHPAAVSAPPAVPKKVTVRLESDPPGANVVDAVAGGVLGTTPLVLTRPRGGTLEIRMEKDGFSPNLHAVSLDDDQTIELTLEHKAAPRPHVHKASHAEPVDSEPAKL
ncbi:MAG TPA: protein kinase [Polyangia bacterium]|nr:protein kinase [Polyangia bacterium]